MAELKILGAQRVKALQERLDLIKKDTLATARKALPTDKDLKQVVDVKYGMDDIRLKLELAQANVERLKESLNRVTGEFESGYSAKQSTDWYKDFLKLKKEHVDDKLADIEKNFKRRASDLWLCETLEEAKRIVGLE